VSEITITCPSRPEPGEEVPGAEEGLDRVRHVLKLPQRQAFRPGGGDPSAHQLVEVA
jgi:hypothetical protein